MKISELRKGTIFCIEGSRTYPKLKLHKGYVDVRDEIYKYNPLDREVEVIEKKELYDDFWKRFRWDKQAVDNLLSLRGKDNGED